MTHPFFPAASLRRRSLLLGGGTLLGGLALPARSQEVARIYVGFAAGGVTDLAARMLAPALSEELGQTFIVENRPGASSALAIKAVEGSAPASNTFVLYPTLALLGFLLNGQQPALDRITPVSLLYEQFAVLAINPQVAGLENVRTLQDLLHEAKHLAGQHSQLEADHVSAAIQARRARAGRAAGLLRKAGYEKASAVTGGLAAWREAGLPVDKKPA